MFDTGILGVAFMFSTALAVGVAYAAYWLAGLFFSDDAIEAPKYNNYPIQTAMKGGPVIKVYGTERIAGNVIWLGILHPYTVRHEAGGGGGKGGEGESGTDVEETRYRRSFLLAICEGPAVILRAWKGKEEISVGSFTWFDGDNNSGIRALTGEDYGDWPNLCCAFFDEYELGNSEALPNITFEVASGTGLEGKTLIYDLAGLQAMNDDLSADYVLMTDIDASDTVNWNGGRGFIPIGEPGDEYKGTLDGRNHTISNLYQDTTTYGEYTSFIGVLGDPVHASQNGHVKKLKLIDFTIANVRMGQTGLMIGSMGKSCTATDCYVSGSIHVYIGHKIGGFVGGIGQDCQLTRCGAVLDFIEPWESGSYNGGFYGLNSSTGVVFTDCYARANIAQPGGDCKTGIPTGGFGGEADENVDSGTYTRCYAAGSIQYQNSCYTYIYDTRPSSFLGGGFFGYVDNPTITSCYWDTEEGSSIYPDAAKFASGYKNERQGHHSSAAPTDGHFHIIHDGQTTGEIAWDATEPTVQSAVDATFGIGEIMMKQSGNPFQGHLKCMFYGPSYGYSVQPDMTFDMSAIVPGGTTVSTYDDVTGVAPLSDAQITGKTTAQMQMQTTFIGWDFDNVWYMGDSGYPELRMQRLDGDDMNPADIIRNIIEDTRYGAGKTTVIDDTSLNAAGDTWDAQDMRLSIKLDSQKPWLDWVDYILAHVGGYRFNSEGALHFGVLKDDAAVDDIGQYDFVRKEGTDTPPAVDITKRKRSETFNRVIIGFSNRDKRYEIDYVKAEDRVDQRLYGVREKVVKLIGIHNKEQAQGVAWRFLIDALFRFSIYKFILTFNKMLLEKGDVITLTDGELLDSERVRIMNINEDRDGRGLAITAMDDLAIHYPDITGYQSQENLHTPDPAVTLTDAAVNFREDVTGNKIYLSLVPGSAYFNGAYIYRSFDDTTYSLIGRCGVDGVNSGDANSAGTITGSLPGHGSMTWAPDESVLVSIGTVTDLRTDVTEDEFWHDRYLARIGDEIIAFKSAEETATAGIWLISNLRRGIFGTEPVAHSSGELFVTLDPNYTYSYDPADIGQKVYFKAVVFYGDNIQDISDLSGFSVTIAGYYQRPSAASLLRLTSDENDGGSGSYSGAGFTLYWNLGSRVSGWNVGPWDVSGGGVPWNNYTADDDLQAIVLKFEETDGTPIGQREITVAESETITKATDLGGFDNAVIKVVPRRTLESRLENPIEVTTV